MFFLRSNISSAFIFVMSLPSSRIAPEVGWCRPSRCLSSVLLPEPEPPMTTMISPCLALKFTWSRIIRGP